MAVGAPQGLITTDNVPSSILYTEITRSIELTAAERELFRDLFCVRTEKKTVRVAQSAARFRTGGDDHGEPGWDRYLYRDISLSEPVKYHLAVGHTKEAWERGLSSQEVRDLAQDAMKADERLIQELVIAAMLKDGGFWDASMSVAPPAYKMNSFTTSHDHYLAYNVSGSLTLAHIAAAKQDILEHGYAQNGGLMGWMNSAQAEKLEGKAELNTTSNYVTTPTIARLQEAGIFPEKPITIAGVPLVVNDWVPENYILIVDTNVKPCYWRDVEGPGKDLITETEDDFTKVVTMYRRYGSVKVTQRGAGACIYLGGASWTDPTFDY